MKNTTAVGKKAEALAADFLKTKGYEIIVQNYRDRFCEIDIVCKNHDYICFVEVKYRSSDYYGGGFGAIYTNKQQRLKKSAEFWLTQNTQYANLQPRIDVIAVDGRYNLSHIENAIY